MIRLSPTAIREYVGRLPTTDLYFLNPLAELKRQRVLLPRVRNLAPNVYRIGSTAIVVRYGTSADIERLRRAGAKRIVYVADDDFAAGAADQSLPESYRARLADFAKSGWPALTAAADIVVVPGDVLAGQYGAKSWIVAPAWHLAPTAPEHFARKTIEIVHLGTGSHRGDLAGLASSLATVLDAHPKARLTLFAGGAAPGPLQNHPHVRSRPPLSWWRYKRALPGMRFNLALYPLADTPFNRARSANKFYEHAIVGAASLMSANPALRSAAGAELAEIFLEGGAQEWADHIAALLQEPDRLRERAEATRAHTIADNPLARAASIWREILAPEL